MSPPRALINYLFDPKVAKLIFEIRMAQAKLIYGISKSKKTKPRIHIYGMLLEVVA